MLDFYAGPSALKTINEQGFKADLFNSFLGASGGPKWFTLFGLDKYLFGDFFVNRSKPLNIIGSSAGAFRAACFCTNDPVSAVSDFAKRYSEITYESKRPTPQQVTDSAIDLVDSLLGKNSNRINEIITNPLYKAHFIVTKVNGLVASENKLLQGIGLLKSYIKNYQSRKGLSSQYQRFIYHSVASDIDLYDPYNIQTHTVNLSADNFKDALLASGCIPLIMAGIKDITGSPEGVYRDGGIIDYHFDFHIKNQGLTLYPHFSHTIKAGWFDKNLQRSFKPENYNNIVFVCPSKKFIQSLPYTKIPDRNDFHTLDDSSRIKYWKKVLVASEQLAQSFDDFYQHQQLKKIKVISLLST
ncbi:patatin-like phospholipase family protein [Colwellia demingiae]|uniref:Patatin-like phospholipase family protein n=1 Tax=Colwellia demingiae TaxID=89401 RepID=A0A5C6QGA7_9GAMM|nr:patatin-like phospholipase family protein [Colwellia demingiae]TWX68076.1 patatin-like phospholipase family protein [Colwellia demingiae]